MKKSLIVIGLLLGGISLNAEEQIFIGVDLGQVKLTGSSEEGTNSGSNESSSSIKIGKNFTDYRIYGKYTYVEIEKSTLSAITLHYDKYFTYKEIKPFIGAEVGYITLTDDESFGGDNLAMSGLTYGLNIGAIHDINQKISLEIGFEYILTSASDNICTETLDDNCVKKSTINLDSYTNLKIGFNYKF